MGPVTSGGTLASGAQYRYEVPATWNGVLLLYSRPVPVPPRTPPWNDDEPSVAMFVDRGYAVAGSANTIFWPLESSFADLPEMAKIFATEVGAPRRTIGFGLSIGGIITAGLVQRSPGLLSGALSTCGNLAGAVAVHNRELDIAFVIGTLLAADTDLQLVRIEAPEDNLRTAMQVLGEAAATPTGRARLALSAAVGNVPGWHDPGTEEPAATDVAARLRNQVAWFEQPGFLVYFQARAQVEMQAGGNPSWNTDSDYRQLVADSVNADEVHALYAEAALDLEDDLDRLAAAPRVEADAGAVAYLEDHIVFDGNLRGVPVLTMHTDGDGLVTPDNQHAYADVVRWAGHEDELRQVYVHRGGHCSFTSAELVTGLEVLLERIEEGRWPDLTPSSLNDRAAAIGAGPATTRSGVPADPAFFDYEPRPFPRPYDVRMVSRPGGPPVASARRPVS